MAPKFFIGIDVSKLTLDLAIWKDGEVLEQHSIPNTTKDVTALLLDLKKRLKCTRLNSFLCAEQMGVYNNFLLAAVTKKKYTICIDSPLQIKRSLGIQRGKSDKIDAIRIAQYAAKNHAALKAWEEPRQVIRRLKSFSSLRKRLLKARTMFLNNTTVEKHFMDKKEQQLLNNLCSNTIASINSDIKQIEQEISRMIQEDERLRHLYEIITSVPYIGPVIATELLLCTNEFLNITTARKFASYCGIAPFEYSSGTSIKGRTKVSGLANKEMKSLLHIAAVASLRKKDSALSLYYKRKVSENKHKMSVINAMRNKLVHYVFACVHNDRPFETYLRAAL